MHDKIVLMVRGANSDTQELEVDRGRNLREVLLEKGLTPYRGKFRKMNCRGLGVCGSCQVLKKEDGEWWLRRSCQMRCLSDMEILLR